MKMKMRKVIRISFYHGFYGLLRMICFQIAELEAEEEEETKRISSRVSTKK